jgi:ribosomal protein S27AE
MTEMIDFETMIKLAEAEVRQHRIECPNCGEAYIHCTWEFVAEVLERGDCPKCREDSDE